MVFVKEENKDLWTGLTEEKLQTAVYISSLILILKKSSMARCEAVGQSQCWCQWTTPEAAFIYGAIFSFWKSKASGEGNKIQIRMQ